MDEQPTNPAKGYPKRSTRTTEKLFTWDEVRALLDKETMRRAEYIARILEALRQRFGDEVMTIAAKVIYMIGYEKGQMRAHLMAEQGQPNDLNHLKTLVSHEMAQLYLGNTTVVKDNDEMEVREEYCPLVTKWSEMGITGDQLINYCLLFDQVDKGMIEGYNPDYEVEITGCWGLINRGYCGMIVRRRKDKI